MADSTIMLGSLGTGSPTIRVYDLGDGAHSLGMLVSPWDWMRVTGDGDTLIKSGPGILGGIILNNPVAGLAVTIYDEVTNSGDIFGVVTLPAVLLDGPGIIALNVKMGTGIVVDLSLAADITVLYR